MPKKKFPLAEGSSSTVELAWRGMWKDFTVSVDGRELGRMNGQGELAQGSTYTLEDGSTLMVMLDKSFGSGGLNVTRNGVPLPGSNSDPKAQLSAAAGVTFFIGGFNILLGALAEAVEIQILLDNGIGIFNIIFGVVFLALGFAVRKGSKIALIVAIALFALDGIGSLYLSIEAGASPGVGGIVFRVFLLIAMAKPLGSSSKT